MCFLHWLVIGLDDTGVQEQTGKDGPQYLRAPEGLWYLVAHEQVTGHLDAQLYHVGNDVMAFMLGRDPGAGASCKWDDMTPKLEVRCASVKDSRHGCNKEVSMNSPESKVIFCIFRA